MMRQIKAPTFAELYSPKLLTVFREGYGLADFRADLIAGLTVAIVALPLSMAIAIASGVTPDRGLYTAVIGGFLVSLLGGSRFQIGGPAGAFIVLVAATVERHGVDGVILATLMAGTFLIAAGLLRLGTYIKFIPYPVTVGFTAGIAVIIFASQLKDLLGITLRKGAGRIDCQSCRRWRARCIPSRSPAVAVSRWSVIMIIATSRAAAELARHPDRGGRCGIRDLGLVAAGGDHRHAGSAASRASCRAPALPAFSLAKVQAVLPDAIAFALLGAIESLLSAVVADGMTGRRHRSNCELVAQGFANIGSALFGGLCVTGTIARTATNVRAGARGPVSGMLHSVFLLLFMLTAAPLASYIPLAALAAVLVVVAWNMAEKHEFATLVRSSWGDATVLLVTFLLTIFRDLTEGILVGFALGAVLFINRMAQMTGIEAAAPLAIRDRPDGDRPRALRFRPCHRSGRAGVPHHRRVLLRRGLDRRHRARQHCRPAKILCGRFLGGAVPGFHRGERDGPRRGQGKTAGHPPLHHRRVAGGAPRAADPWREPAAGAIPRDGCARGRRHQGT